MYKSLSEMNPALKLNNTDRYSKNHSFKKLTYNSCFCARKLRMLSRIT